jgi:hypothetical protein
MLWVRNEQLDVVIGDDDLTVDCASRAGKCEGVKKVSGVRPAGRQQAVGSMSGEQGQRTLVTNRTSPAAFALPRMFTKICS